jgi:hypothetical protein
MFEPSDWNLTQYSEDCIKKFGVKPQPYLAENLYGGRARDIIAASNIVFRSIRNLRISGNNIKANKLRCVICCNSV